MPRRWSRTGASEADASMLRWRHRDSGAGCMKRQRCDYLWIALIARHACDDLPTGVMAGDESWVGFGALPPLIAHSSTRNAARRLSRPCRRICSMRRIALEKRIAIRLLAYSTAMRIPPRSFCELPKGCPGACALFASLASLNQMERGAERRGKQRREASRLNPPALRAPALARACARCRARIGGVGL